MTVNIEYELQRTDMTLREVNVFIPLGTTDQPRMGEIDGQFKHNSRDGVLLWHQSQIDSSNPSGSMEFTVNGNNVNAFFPCQVQFSSTLYAPLEVSNVANSDGPVEFELRKTAAPENYVVS